MLDKQASAVKHKQRRMERKKIWDAGKYILFFGQSKKIAMQFGGVEWCKWRKLEPSSYQKRRRVTEISHLIYKTALWFDY